MLCLPTPTAEPEKLTVGNDTYVKTRVVGGTTSGSNVTADVDVTVYYSLDNWNQNQNKVFLGIKAPSGSGTVIINGREIAINNTTDIYYDITGYANVSNNVATFKITAGSELISVTTIKVTGTADFTIRDDVFEEE